MFLLPFIVHLDSVSVPPNSLLDRWTHKRLMLVNLPFVFYSGCQNGEEETEQDMHFTSEEAKTRKHKWLKHMELKVSVYNV